MVETVVVGRRAGGGDQVEAVLGAAAVVDLTVVEVEVAALVEELLVGKATVEALVVPMVDVGAVVVGGAVVVLLDRVTYANGAGVGGRDTPSVCNSSC